MESKAENDNTMLLRSKRRNWLFATTILIIQILVALGTSCFFFNSDTIYFLSRQLHGIGDVGQTLLQYDDRGNFRPFTLWLSSSLFVPLGGLHPWAYHLLAALFHALNTWLCYRLVRILSGSQFASLMAAFFFGLHKVLFHATYGLVCLPDLSYVFFTLLSLLAFQKHLNSGAEKWKAWSLLAAVGAFLSKEMAVILPLLMLALCWMKSAGERPRHAWQRRIAESFGRTLLHWALLVLYLTYFAVLGKGSILPAEVHHPYAVEFSVPQVIQRMPYFSWLGNFPRFFDRSRGPSELMQFHAGYFQPANSGNLARVFFQVEGVTQWAAVTLWLPVLLWAVYQTCRRSEIRRFLPLCLALVLSLMPVLFLVNKMMPHNLYLAVVGLAIWLALCVESDSSNSRRHLFPRVGITEYAVVAYLFTSLASMFNAMNHSWLTHGSMMAKSAVADMQRTLPNLAPDARLYFLRSIDSGLPWYYEGGNLFRIILNKPQLSVRFQARQDPLPTPQELGDNSRILMASGSHLFDVTEEYLPPERRTFVDLLPYFDLSTATVNRQEYYPQYDRFDTPTGQPVFKMLVHQGNLGRQALVTIAGVSVVASLPPLDRAGILQVGRCLAMHEGDGIIGRLWIRDEQGERLLLEEEILPGRGRTGSEWVDTRYDLSAYAGRPLQLKLETRNQPGRTTVADWLAWNLRLLPKEPAKD